MRSAKAGRKAKHYIAADGTQIKGLARDAKSGRWRIIGTGKFFRETDEAKAIDRFYELTQHPNRDPIQTLLAAGIDMRHHIGTPMGQLLHRLAVADSNKRDVWAELWRFVGEEIRRTPRLIAELTGVEQIAYFRGLKPPEPLPTFAELETIFRDHFKKSDENKRKVLAAWDDFKRTSGAKSLEDITPELVVAYRDVIHEQRGTGKSQSNIFNRVRRLITFAKSRAVAVKELSEVLNVLSLLTPSDTTVSLDPKPIEVEDWQKLHEAAEGENLAMLLVCLNAAMYLTEVVRLKWSDIRPDGTIITHRHKEGRCVRVCTLWPETIAALENVPRKGDHIFNAYSGAPLGVKGAELRFRKLRDGAKVPHVTSSQLRDGAATAAASANVNQQLIALLLGHRTGIGDHYVKRNPKMVAPACEAVRSLYMG